MSDRIVLQKEYRNKAGKLLFLRRSFKIIVAPGKKNNCGQQTCGYNKENPLAEPEKHQVPHTKTEAVNSQGTQNPVHYGATEIHIPVYLRELPIDRSPKSWIGFDFFAEPSEMIRVRRRGQ